MIRCQRKKQWIAVVLAFMMVMGLLPEREVFSAEAEILDQKQEQHDWNILSGNGGAAHQTFMPGVTGNLSKVDVHVVYVGRGSLTGIQVKILNSSWEVLATAQVGGSQIGWRSVSFTGTQPYLTRDTTYIMEINPIGSSDLSVTIGLGKNNPYPRGQLSSVGDDLAFRTYMIPDYSLSAALSGVTTAASSFTANGTSQTTITVRLRDAQGNNVTTGGAAVSIASTLGTVSTVTDKGNGTYTATLRAPTTLGTATVSAKLGGVAIGQTVNVQFVPGTATAARSSLEAGTGTLPADGTSQTTVTVSLRDAQGHLTTIGGAVSIVSTLGTVSSVTDNGNGTYTATLKAPVTLGTATVSAKFGSTSISQTAAVQFVPGPPSSSKSTIQTSASTLIADGSSQMTVTVRLKDEQGHSLTTGGANVRIGSSSGSISATTDHGNGTYTAVLTAPTRLGRGSVNASLNGWLLDQWVNIYFVPGPLSAASSTIEAGHGTLAADGTSQTTVTVRLRDAQGHGLTTGGETVELTATLGTISSVTDKGNGTYTAVLTAPLTLGLGTVSGTAGGNPIGGTASVQFVPGEASPANSIIEAGASTLSADGASQTAITVKLKDSQGHSLTSGGASVTVDTTLGTVSSVVDNLDGTYTALLTAPTTLGIATISAQVGGTAITETVSVRFVPGALSAASSAIEAGTATLTADGMSQTTITVILKDAQGNTLTSGGATVTINTTLGTVGAVTDNHDGTYTAALTSSTILGTAMISGYADGSLIGETASVHFVPDGISPSVSTVTASDLVVRADGKSQATITVRLMDDYGHPLSGNQVALQASGGRSVIDAVYKVTDLNGYAAFAVSNIAAEQVTYYAQEYISGLRLNQEAYITFTYDQPPSITLLADPVIDTFGSVTVTVTASAYGAFNSISTIKWSPGVLSLHDFESNGEEITDSFTLYKNGLYSVYVQDAAGNANVRTIEISNIVPLSTNNDLSDWQLTGIGGDISFTFHAETLSYTLYAGYSIEGLKMQLTAADAYAAIEVNGSPVTDEYRLDIGTNRFEIKIIAQDSSVKQYWLHVIRMPEAAVEGPSSRSHIIRINDREIPGAVSLHKGSDVLEVRLDSEKLKAALDSYVKGESAEIVVMIEEAADTVILQLSGKVISLLGESDKMTLHTRYGYYHLPLAEVLSLQLDWANNPALQIHMYSQMNGTYLLLSGMSPFTDMTGHWAEAEVNEMSRRMILRGIGNGLFAPEAVITRAELAAILARALGLPQVERQSDFKDIGDTSWYSSAAAAVKVFDLMGGYPDGTFKPDQKVSRQEAIVVIMRALRLAADGAAVYGVLADLDKYTDSHQISEWAVEELRTAVAEGLITGYGDKLLPHQWLTRAETTVLIFRMLQKAGIMIG